MTLAAVLRQNTDILVNTVLPRKLGDLGYGDLENMPVFTRTVTWLRGFPMLQIRIATWLW